MKLKYEYAMSEVGDAVFAVMPENPGKMIKLNGTGAYILELLKNETTEEEIVAAICGKYDVAAEKARGAVADFIEALRRDDLL